MFGLTQNFPDFTLERIGVVPARKVVGMGIRLCSLRSTTMIVSGDDFFSLSHSPSFENQKPLHRI